MSVQYFSRAKKPKLAYIYSPATSMRENAPLVVFLGGFRSDMSGTKATYFEQQCKARGQGYLRLDYNGHGLSGGKFEEGTIGSWKDDALAVLDHVWPNKPVVLVGSSMGGWIALLVALTRPEHIHGIVGIAAAPDFTRDLYEKHLTPAQRKQMDDTGYAEVPNEYSEEPYIFTRALIEDGKQNALLNKNYNLNFPIQLVQGKLDPDVPWETALNIQKAFGKSNTDIDFIEDGDHRLSRPQDLALIDHYIQKLSDL